MFSTIQYISSGHSSKEQMHHIQSILDIGIDWIQLRFKTATKTEFLTTAQYIKSLQERYKFTFIINDHIEIAALVNADGVHLGLNDESVLEARKILGPEKIIGGTANTYADICQRIHEKCDYIGLGPLRFTSSKENLSPIIGFDGYSRLFEQLKTIQHPPIYAIGGITIQDINPLTTIGIHGVAMSSQLEINVNRPNLNTQHYV